MSRRKYRYGSRAEAEDRLGQIEHSLDVARLFLGAAPEHIYTRDWEFCGTTLRLRHACPARADGGMVVRIQYDNRTEVRIGRTEIFGYGCEAVRVLREHAEAHRGLDEWPRIYHEMAQWIEANMDNAHTWKGG